MIIFDPVDTWKKTKVLGGTYELRELLIPVIRQGKRVYTSPEVMELREYCLKEQNTLWDESRRLVNPQKVYVDLSQQLYGPEEKSPGRNEHEISGKRLSLIKAYPPLCLHKIEGEGGFL